MATKRLIEVERKFCSAGPAALLASGHPPFRSLEYHGSRTFNDKYFDRDHLRNAGSLHPSTRQALGSKSEKGGDYINSQFEETTSISKIAAFARNVAGVQGMVNAEDDFRLDLVAELKTTRQSWTANGKFKIVLDATDFGHTVGEVELEKEVKTRAGSKTDIKYLAEMDQVIVDFTKMYTWAFPPGIPKGKLAAYFERQRYVKYEALDTLKLLLNLTKQMNTQIVRLQPFRFKTLNDVRQFQISEEKFEAFCARYSG